MELINILKSNADANLADFQCKTIPTVDKKTVLGIRTATLRKIALEMVKNGEYVDFLQEKHYYYEEILIHGFILGYAKFDIDELLNNLERFLPTIDNWAVCDGTVSSLKAIKNHYSVFYEKCKEWLNSDKPYTVRFAVVILLSYYLDGEFDNEIFRYLCKINTDEYYVNMAVAWYISVALVKQYDDAVEVLEQKKIINSWIHDKAIQKATESFRIDKERKAYLRTLKIKNK